MSSFPMQQKLLYSLIMSATLYCTSLISQPATSDLFVPEQQLEFISVSTNSVNQSQSYWKTGALIGFGVGVTGSAIAVYQGGSTSLCNQSKNQDATSTGACLSIIGGSGLVMGGIGALIGSTIKKSLSEETRDRLGFQINAQNTYGQSVSVLWTF